MGLDPIMAGTSRKKIDFPQSFRKKVNPLLFQFLMDSRILSSWDFQLVKLPKFVEELQSQNGQNTDNSSQNKKAKNNRNSS
jgi:hypothetical protein